MYKSEDQYWSRLSGTRGDLPVAIVTAITALITISLILACVGVYWAARESDSVSVVRQARSAEAALEGSVDELALQQETVAIWDDSATHLALAHPRSDWAQANIGGWLSRVFGQDEVIILDGSDKPIYASIQGKRASPVRYQAVHRDLSTLVDGVRGRDERAAGRHDRKPSVALNRYSTVRTTSRTTHCSRLLLVGGRLAAASAMLIQPSTPNLIQPPRRWPVLLSVRYLDGGFLADLGYRELIASPRYSRSPQDAAGERSITLRNGHANPLGYLFWKPDLPGQRIMWKLFPITLLILLGLASFMTFLGRRLGNAVRELSVAEAHAGRLAFHDSLTGLPNRAAFQQRLGELQGNNAVGVALVLVDLDEFKLTNDTLGHDAGDAVLASYADRLRTLAGPKSLVARLGGDEFAVLLHGMAAGKLEAFSSRLITELRKPLSYQGKLIYCGASAGGSELSDSDSASSMLKHADLALYEAKRSGRGIHRLYEPGMWSNMLLKREMLSVAGAGLAGNFIEPYYQPKVDLKSGAVVGFEALLRCCVPGLQPEGPACLAAAFEDAVLAVKLSDRMIDRVISDIGSWQAASIPFGHVAINVGLAELRRGDFAQRMLSKMRKARVSHRLIQIEVTESVLLGEGIAHIERTLNELAASGIKLSLDDFGTGFASLTHLKRFPIGAIKIDKSFVQDLQIDAGDGAIVDALVSLGRALKIEVVAEGIETKAQRDFLGALGCGVGQGFLFGRAVPAHEVAVMLEDPSVMFGRQAA
jgi:diguanylate cyclase (GGDEF)-like protein